jgi:hypothetical protein
VPRYLTFAERGQSYNQIVAEVKIGGRSSIQYAWEQE